MVYNIRDQLRPVSPTTYRHDAAVASPGADRLKLLLTLAQRSKAGGVGSGDYGAAISRLGGPIKPTTKAEKAANKLLLVAKGEMSVDRAKNGMKNLKPDLVPLWQELQQAEHNAQKASKNEGGVVNWIFDKLSRVNYGVANIAEERYAEPIKHALEGKVSAGDFVKLLTGGNPLKTAKAGWEGFSGKEKEDFIDKIIKVNNNKMPESGWGKAAVLGGGLALDIFTDPTTYIGAGAIKSVGKAGRLASRGAGLTKLSDESKAIADQLVARGLQPGYTKKVLESQQKILAKADEFVSLPKKTVSGTPRTLQDLTKDTATRIRKTPKQALAKEGELPDSAEDIFRYLGGDRIAQTNPLKWGERSELTNRGSTFFNKLGSTKAAAEKSAAIRELGAPAEQLLRARPGMQNLEGMEMAIRNAGKTAEDFAGTGVVPERAQDLLGALDQGDDLNALSRRTAGEALAKTPKFTDPLIRGERQTLPGLVDEAGDPLTVNPRDPVEVLRVNQTAESSFARATARLAQEAASGTVTPITRQTVEMMSKLVATTNALAQKFEVAGLYHAQQAEALPGALAKSLESADGELDALVSAVQESKKALDTLVDSGAALPEQLDAATKAYTEATINLERTKSRVNALRSVLGHPDDAKAAADWASERALDALTTDELKKLAATKGEIAEHARRLIYARDYHMLGFIFDPEAISGGSDIVGRFMNSKWLYEQGGRKLIPEQAWETGFTGKGRSPRAGYNLMQAIFEGTESKYYQKLYGEVKDAVDVIAKEPEFAKYWNEGKGSKEVFEGMKMQIVKDGATLIQEMLTQEFRKTYGLKIGGQVVLPLFSRNISNKAALMLRLSSNPNPVIAKTAQMYNAMFMTANKISPDIAQLKGQVFGSQERYLNTIQSSYKKIFGQLSRKDRKAQYDQIIMGTAPATPIALKNGVDATEEATKELKELGEYFFYGQADGTIINQLHQLNRWLPGHRQLKLSVVNETVTAHNNVIGKINSSIARTEKKMKETKSATKIAAYQTDLDKLIAKRDAVPQLKALDLFKSTIAMSDLGRTGDLSEVLWQMRVAQQKVIAQHTIISGLRDFGTPLSHIGEDGLYKNFTAQELQKSHGYKEISRGDFEGSLNADIAGLEGYVFEPGMREDMIRVLKLTQPGAPGNRQIASMFAGYDSVQRAWKKLVTQYNIPGYYVRNTFSDFFMNMLNGVSLRGYTDGAHILRHSRRSHGHPEWDTIPKTMADPHEPRLAFNPQKAADEDMTGYKFVSLKPDEAKAMGRADAPYITAPEVWSSFVDNGLNSSMFHVDFAKNIRASNVGGPLGRGIKTADEALTTVGMARDDYFRISHFASSIKRAMKNGHSYEDAVDIAANDVRKYLFDYSDFTTIEKQFFSRVIPFYKWMRKSIPLTLQSIVTDPGKVAVYGKMMNALAQSSDSPMSNDTFLLPGGEWVIPQYMLDKALVPVGERYGDTVYMGFSNPVVDTLGMVNKVKNANNPLQGILQILTESATPMGKAPFELAQGSKASGANIESTAGYLGGMSGPINSYYKLATNKPDGSGYEQSKSLNSGAANTFPIDPRILQVMGVTAQANTPDKIRSAIKQRLEAAKTETSRKKKEQGIVSEEQTFKESFPWN